MPFFPEFISISLLKDALLAINLSLLLVNALLFAVLVTHKMHVERRARRLSALKTGYSDDLTCKYYDRSYHVRPPSTNLEFEACGSAFADLIMLDDRDMDLKLRQFFRDLGVDQYYIRRLRSRSWVKRYSAIEKLGFLRLPELRPLFSSCLEQERNLRVVSKLIWALSLIAQEGDMKLINGFLRNPRFMSGKFNEYIYINIIDSFCERLPDRDIPPPEGQAASLAKAFHGRRGEADLVRLISTLINQGDIPLSLKRDIIQACGAKKLTPAQGTILGAYRRHNDTPEFKIACIRALERIAAPHLSVTVSECLTHPDWRVRTSAAKDAHRCGPDIIHQLRRAMYDENYLVRVNAAQSLMLLSFEGREALLAERKSEDHFVRDVSNFALKRLHCDS